MHTLHAGYLGRALATAEYRRTPASIIAAAAPGHPARSDFSMPRAQHGTANGRFPGSRVIAGRPPSRLPGGMVAERSPSTVAGAAPDWPRRVASPDSLFLFAWRRGTVHAPHHSAPRQQPGVLVTTPVLAPATPCHELFMQKSSAIQRRGVQCRPMRSLLATSLFADAGTQQPLTDPDIGSGAVEPKPPDSSLTRP